MRSRHKIPSVFNLSMVDVMCCALGCVIFLWSQYMATARSRKAEADRLQKEADRLQKEAADNARRSGETAKLLDQARLELEKLRKSEQDLRQLILVLQGQLTDANKLASTNQQKAEEAEGKHQQSLVVISTLKKDVEKLEKDGRSQAQIIIDLKNQISAHLKALKDIEGRYAELLKLKEQLDKTVLGLKSELGKKETALRDAGKTIDDLKGKAGEHERVLREREELKKDNERWQLALKRKFAGIDLDGQRVIFLVDMSGSMAFLRGEENDPTKWPTVRETVLRVMKSLPDLKEFQLITFSNAAEFPLKKKGEWIRYDENTSLREVEQALKNIEPRGGTNLYEGLESAFAYREKGLDTIYLFSDGLPSLGAGLTKEEEKLPDGPERARKLSEHLRKTLKEKWNAEKQGQPRVRIQAVGFYYESPDVGAFLWALAREHGGSFVGMNKP